MSDEPRQFLLYTALDGAVKVDVFIKGETVWLTQKAMAELFGVKVPAINKHLKNIFESGELVEQGVISILETTAADGKNYATRYYSLDPIIAVGYRVDSYQATQFRIWATKTLREFIIKGFVLDDERLTQGRQVFLKPRIPRFGTNESEFPGDAGFSHRNIVYMREFFLTCRDDNRVQPLVAQSKIPKSLTGELPLQGNRGSSGEHR